MLNSGLAAAATYNLPSGFGSSPFSSCTWNAGTATAACTDNISVEDNHTTNFTTGMTMQINGNFTVGNGVTIAGNGNSVLINVNGNITFGNGNNSSVNFSTNGNFTADNNATITGNITANGNVQIGNNGSVTGNVTANGNITLGNNTIVDGTCSPMPSGGGTCTGGPTLAPVADYRFDECSWTSGASGAVIDSAGSFHGTPHSTNTVSGGVVNHAADLSASGTADYIKWPIALLNGRSDFTISLWFKTSISKSQQEIIHGLGSGSGDDEIEIYLINSTGIRVNIFDSGNNYTAGSSFVNGAWHHLAVTRSGTSVCVYLDSTSLGCNTRGSGALSFTNANSLLTGQEQDSFGGSFSSSQALEAQLDEFKVFTAALSTSSISSIYANELAGNNWDGSSRSNPCLTPMVEYRFEEASWNGTSGEVADSSGNGYTGTAGSLSATKPTTVDTSSAIAGNPGTCRYGVFTRANKDYIALPSSFPNLGSTGQAFTITAWVKTTDNTRSGQRILIDDQSNSSGYGFSLGDGGTGRLRFFSRGTPSRIILDTGNVIANNTWYFVAAVIDVPNKIKRIYAFNSAGTLLTSVSSAAWTESSFGSDSGIASIGGETNDSGENTSSFGFSGNLDEVNVFTGALSQSDLTTVLARTHPCPASVNLDHIRLEHDGDGLTCMAETITIKACVDANCTSLYSAGSTSVTLSGTGWSSNPITFTGSTTVNLSKTTPQTVALGTSTVSPSPAGATQCYVGVNPNCNLIFSDVGFIIASVANGSEATIPSQTAGTTSATYYLRAIKTSTTTGACEAALVGANSVDLAYECNDPATCYAANLMSANGGTATTIARNNGGNVTSYTSVGMTFDANGNAPFTFNYSDAGQARLHAAKAAGGQLLTALSGSSNAFVVRPSGFVLTAIQQTAAPNLANPGAADANGNKFVKAGEDFSATVTAKAGSGTAYSFGRESTLEEVTLNHVLVVPTGGAAGTLGNATIAGGSFTNGIATVTNLFWSEVGIITLTPGNSNYLGTGSVTGTTSGNIGRFIPDHFTITPGAVTEGCDAGNFTYFGQDGFATPFTLTAQNAANWTTQNYMGNFAKLDLTLWNNYIFTATWDTTPNPSSTLSASATAPTGSWSNGVASVSAIHQASRPASPVAPANITINAKPTDTDGVTIATVTPVQTAATPLRYGRLVLKNAYGTEREALKMYLHSQYYTGSAFTANTADTCTSYSAAALACTDANTADTLVCADVTVSGTDISNGQHFTLSAPNKTGPLLYTMTVAPWLKYEWDNADNDYNENPAARANFGIYRGNDRILNWREIIR